MYSALDIAKWFLNYNLFLRNVDNEDTDDISNLKLQKLLYYAQGCYLAMYDAPLFKEDIVAWAHGPVVREVYDEYKAYGSGGITPPDDYPEIDDETNQFLIEVYGVFGIYSAWGLRDMTHKETPWLSTMKNDVIDRELIKEYFKENYVK